MTGSDFTTDQKLIDVTHGAQMLFIWFWLECRCYFKHFFIEFICLDFLGATSFPFW